MNLPVIFTFKATVDANMANIAYNLIETFI